MLKRLLLLVIKSTSLDDVFTGSDWCGWCIRLQKEVLLTQNLQNGNVILVELDYPRRTPQALEVKKQNNELQQAFGIQGFPTIYFANGVDTEGKVNFEGLGSTGYVAGGLKLGWLLQMELKKG
jgi:protein disulfide-isomerase